MRLEYAILAVDDEPGSTESFRSAANDHLENEGFDLAWTLCSSEGDLRKQLEKPARFDLVIVDNRLGQKFGGQNGPHWASEIRRLFRYTDIVFYGADAPSDLRRNIAGAEVDGVFCSTRAELVNDLRDLISVQVQRWTDGPAMRALAVGVASELDQLLREACIALAQSTNAEVRKKVYAEVTRAVKERVEDRPKSVAKHIDKDDFEKLFHVHTEFMALELARALAWLAANIPDGEDEAKAFIQRYTKDVITPRNVLAHGSFDESTGMFSTATQSFATTPDNCREFRVTLRSYRQEIRSIRDAAKAGKVVIQKR